MNGANQSYEGYASHPDMGEGVVAGQIFVQNWKLCFQSETARLEIPASQVDVEPDANGEQIWFSDRAQPEIRFFTFDKSVLHDRALRHTPGVGARLKEIAGRGEMGRRWRLVLYAIPVCVLLAWLGSLAMGGAARLAVHGIPLSWDAKQGDALIAKLEKKLPFVDDSNAVEQLTVLAAPLTSLVPTNQVRFTFHLVEYPEPNAFALPGGHIVVTTGLLKLADRPEELLGVLAHEMSHVTRRHALRHQISGMGPIYMVQILAGGRNHALEALAFPSELLVYESFSQEYEREADSSGWNYLVAARINPHGMIDMFEKLEKQEASFGLESRHTAFDSHPAMVKRIAWLQAKWDKLPDKTGFITITNPVPKVAQSDLPDALMKLMRSAP